MHLQLPSDAQRLALLQSLRNLPVTYWERGGTSWPRMPQGYQHDEYVMQIGEGPAAWQAAKTAINSWVMFPKGWTNLLAASPRGDSELPEIGDQVHLVAKLLGVYWSNPARVIYTVEQPNAYGFAYGTLPGHLAQGEELFQVERDANGIVSYRLRVMSRPYALLAKVAKPYARLMQARFSDASTAAMKAFIRERLSSKLETGHRTAHNFKLLTN